MATCLFVLMSISLLSVSMRSQNVKFYLNDCMGNLTLANCHNYTGIAIIPPPSNVIYGSSAIFEYQYASKAEFGSLLDANVNYAVKGQASYDLLHYFFNVNSTGELYTSVEMGNLSYILAHDICTDIKQNQGTLPSVIGLYVYYTNSTLNQCKSITKEIPSCTYF
eukprot:488250_1